MPSEEQIENSSEKPWLWKPGQSGNPGGRPKGTSLTAIIREIVNESEGDKSVGRILVEAAIREAKAGDFRFFKEIIDRIDGKVPDKIAVSDGDRSPMSPEVAEAMIAAGLKALGVADEGPDA